MSQPTPSDAHVPQPMGMGAMRRARLNRHPSKQRSRQRDIAQVRKIFDLAKAKFEETEHPRVPKGSEGGGRFAPKGGSADPRDSEPAPKDFGATSYTDKAAWQKAAEAKQLSVKNEVVADGPTYRLAAYAPGAAGQQPIEMGWFMHGRGSLFPSVAASEKFNAAYNAWDKAGWEADMASEDAPPGIGVSTPRTFTPTKPGSIDPDSYGPPDSGLSAPNKVDAFDTVENDLNQLRSVIAITQDSDHVSATTRRLANKIAALNDNAIHYAQRGSKANTQRVLRQMVRLARQMDSTGHGDNIERGIEDVFSSYRDRKERYQAKFGKSAEAVVKGFGKFEESEHPRTPKGSEGGGRFAPKGGQSKYRPTEAEVAETKRRYAAGIAQDKKDAGEPEDSPALAETKRRYAEGIQRDAEAAKIAGMSHDELSAAYLAGGRKDDDPHLKEINRRNKETMDKIRGFKNKLRRLQAKDKKAKKAGFGFSSDPDIADAQRRKLARDDKKFQRWKMEKQAATLVAMAKAKYEESEHPRYPKGSGKGGEFAPKAGGHVPGVTGQGFSRSDKAKQKMAEMADSEKEVAAMTIADETGADAYSYDRYGEEAWRESARALLDAGYTKDQTREILRSKVMRWAADQAEPKKPSAKAVMTWLKKLSAKQHAALLQELAGTGTQYD